MTGSCGSCAGVVRSGTGTEMGSCALIASPLSSTRGSRTPPARSCGRRAALSYAGDQIIAWLQFAVELLYQLRESMIGGPGLYSCRLQGLVEEQLPYDLGFVFNTGFAVRFVFGPAAY